MADIRMRQKSPVTIKSLDRAAIVSDHLLDRSAKLKQDMISHSREDSGAPEHYATGSMEVRLVVPEISQSILL